MPRTNKATAIAAFWHTLKSLASGECNDDLRDRLKPGGVYPYAVTVKGSVAGHEFEESRGGFLTVDHNREEFSPIDSPHLLALALEAMPHGREAFLSQLEAYVNENGALPPVDEATSKATAALVKRLRHRKRTKRGAVKARSDSPEVVR